MPVRSKPRSCFEPYPCPYLNTGKGYVPPTAPKPPVLGAIVGQGPGAQEVAQGVPFFEKAPSGGFLSQLLERAGLDRRRFLIDNVIRCRIGKDTTPDGAVAECTTRHLFPTLEPIAAAYTQREGRPLPVLAVGIPSARVLQGGWAGQGTAGTLVEVVR